jgi:DNA mismatch repair protein MutL
LEPVNLRQRIVQVFGKNTNEKLVPVQESTDILQLNGFVFKPEFSKKSRQHQFFFVNDRFVKSAYLHHAVLAAFEGLLGPNMQPGYMLYLTVPTETIDVNIHPTKTEVKFEDDHALYAIIRSALKHSLGQFNVSPILDFDRNQSFDVPVGSKPPSQSPSIQVDRNFNPFNENQKGNDWEPLYEGLQDVTIASQKEQIFDDDRINTHSPTLQFHKKYIITTRAEVLIIIHQQRAHQRVLYESLIRQIKHRSVPSQVLAFPIQVEMNQQQLAEFTPHQKTLELMGFNFGNADSNSLEITAIHNSLSLNSVPKFLSNMLENLDKDSTDEENHLKQMLAKIMSKYGSIGTGTELHPSAQSRLIEDLFSCDEPSRCPEGKAIFASMTDKDIKNKLNL